MMHWIFALFTKTKQNKTNCEVVSRDQGWGIHKIPWQIDKDLYRAIEMKGGKEMYSYSTNERSIQMSASILHLERHLSL